MRVNHSEKTIKITSQQVLAWARRSEVQKARRELTEVTKASKAFKAVRKHKHKRSTPDRTKANRRETLAKCPYTQAQAFPDWSFQDFTTIEKFLCIQIFPIDSSVKLPHISSFLYQEKCLYQDLKQWKSMFLPFNIEIPLAISTLYFLYHRGHVPLSTSL